MMSQQNLVRDSEVVLQRTIHMISIAAMDCIHFKRFFTDGFSKAAGSACQGAKQARLQGTPQVVGAFVFLWVFCVMRILRSQLKRIRLKHHTNTVRSSAGAVLCVDNHHPFSSRCVVFQVSRHAEKVEIHGGKGVFVFPPCQAPPAPRPTRCFL